MSWYQINSTSCRVRSESMGNLKDRNLRRRQLSANSKQPIYNYDKIAEDTTSKKRPI